MRPASPSAWWSPTPSTARTPTLGSQAVRRARSPTSWGSSPRMARGSRSTIPPTHRPSPPLKRPRACRWSAWERTVRFDSHGKELVRYVVELELGPSYGPTKACA